jgi:hypothetical protein
MPSWINHPALPFAITAFMAFCSIAIAVNSKFKTLRKPYWPYAQRPGLAMELADSTEFVDCILGDPRGEPGSHNRRVAIRIQYLDFPFILAYMLLFAIVAWQISESWFLVPAVLGILTGVADVFEDFHIIGLASGKSARPAKPFGLAKWFLFFVTIGAEGIVLLTARGPANGRIVAGYLLGVFLIGTAIGGAISTSKRSFDGIFSGAALSALLLVVLGSYPLLASARFPWRVVFEYAILMRVPLLAAATLIALPVIAFFTPARTLLRGLFDVTPLGLIAVVLATIAASGAICMSSLIVLKNAAERDQAPPIDTAWADAGWHWICIVGLIAVPVIATAVGFSIQQGRGAAKCLFSSSFTLIAALVIVWGLTKADFSWMVRPFFDTGFAIGLRDAGLLKGYSSPGQSYDPIRDHAKATAAVFTSLLAYVLVGIYGYFKIGKARTVPALASALMLMMLLIWILGAVAFFFDAWRIPVLLIVAVAGTITAQSMQSDHFYKLRARNTYDEAPLPGEVIRHGGRRIIVVAANGGGIQAGAWAAQVLYGLHSRLDGFGDALRMISSVSGGSVGTAYYTHWRASAANSTIPPDSASRSSLDEVAWGLAWPDFLRALLPWIFRKFIGRGRALEEAWRLNGAPGTSKAFDMDRPLSDWNAFVRNGSLPAVIMNATVAESGERLLLATTRMTGKNSLGKARIDSAELHTINGIRWDVGVVTAARISASFPYVTPASRSDGEGPQPHVVDGGYYDNYGMATLVEWLDEALLDAHGAIESVMVIQIHGAPDNVDLVKKPSEDPLVEKRYAKTRGWFYQAIAPITTLLSVRSSGQVAHNDIELTFLKEKWACAKKPVSIETVKFVFPNPKAPLSWHLVPEEQKQIQDVWNRDPEIASARGVVERFLK